MNPESNSLTDTFRWTPVGRVPCLSRRRRHVLQFPFNMAALRLTMPPNKCPVPLVPARRDPPVIIEGRAAFTLIELLITLGTIGLLISILLPSLGAAREQSKAVMCRSNIRQLHLANSYYADDYGGVYCAGAQDFLKNLHRWHGTRKHLNEDFDAVEAPLTPYIGDDGEIRQCPTFPADEIAKYSHGFERGNGGYGYNNRFIGMQLNESSSGAFTVSTDLAGAYVHKIKKPGETIMFTDSGFAANGLIEYSFAEPRFQPMYPTYRAIPSIHFRHLERTNVVWCDGHVDSQKMTFTHASEFYRSKPEQFNIGWFGEADDNSLFDLK